MTIQFNHDPIIRRIVNRWASLRALEGMRTDLMSATMDLAAANGVNGNASLDLEKLMMFKDSDFAHDMGGIARHINRETGEIEDCFLPRCAK